jgi:hypothetical protein
MFGRTLTGVLDRSLFMGKPKIKMTEKLQLEGKGGRKWDENKSGKSKGMRFTRARVKIPLCY